MNFCNIRNIIAFTIAENVYFFAMRLHTLMVFGLNAMRYTCVLIYVFKVSKYIQISVGLGRPN